MTSKVPEHVRAAAIEAAWNRREVIVLSGHVGEINPREYVDAALAAVAKCLDVYCEASNPAWSRPVQLYRFKGCDEK